MDVVSFIIDTILAIIETSQRDNGRSLPILMCTVQQAFAFMHCPAGDAKQNI